MIQQQDKCDQATENKAFVTSTLVVWLLKISSVLYTHTHTHTYRD